MLALFMTEIEHETQMSHRMCHSVAKLRFVHAVTAGGSVKFLPAVYISPFSLIFLCFFLLKLLKLGEIDGVKFLA